MRSTLMRTMREARSRLGMPTLRAIQEGALHRKPSTTVRFRWCVLVTATRRVRPLVPFANGAFGSYRTREAEALLSALSEAP